MRAILLATAILAFGGAAEAAGPMHGHLGKPLPLRFPDGSQTTLTILTDGTYGFVRSDGAVVRGAWWERRDGWCTARQSPQAAPEKCHQYPSKYEPEFSFGDPMTYGSEDCGKSAILVSLDACGHEMAHAFTDKPARLIYSGESGSLSETWDVGLPVAGR